MKKKKKYKVTHEYKTVINLSKDIISQIDELMKEVDELHKKRNLK